MLLHGCKKYTSNVHSLKAHPKLTFDVGLFSDLLQPQSAYNQKTYMREENFPLKSL